MKNELFTIGKTETFNLISRDNGAVIFEGGWWMTEEDHENCFNLVRKGTETVYIPKKNIILGRNEKNKRVFINGYLPI